MSTAETDIDNLEGRMDTAESDIDTIQSDLSELIGDGEGSVQDQIKTALEDYLPLSGGTMTGNITFGSESAPDTNGHEYVDLGLPSGKLWAKCNIGANTEEEAGLHFQWGDTQGYTAEQVGDGEGLKAFEWSDYKFGNPYTNFSKYNASDSKTILDLEDDAAHVNMGGNWRMPTFEEYKELLFNTDIYFVPIEGEEIQGTVQEQGTIVKINWASQVEGTFKGVKFYKKGDKQTYMFVPATGYADEGSILGAGNACNLWSSSLSSPGGSQYAWNLKFYDGDFFAILHDQDRNSGDPVRGVCPKSDSADYTGGIIISGKSDTDLVNAVGGTTTIDSIREGLATEDALNEYKTSNDEKIQSIEDKLDQEIEAGNTDKETIDNYTVNGHKISENPVLTKTDVGLNQVDNVQQIPMSMKGQAGGVAELDANGKVPSSQLESLALGEVAGTAYEGNKGAANKAAIGTNTYTGANYISKETNLTDAVLQLDEEIKATNDNLTLEHENANATYATKAELDGYLPLSGGTLTGYLKMRELDGSELKHETFSLDLVRGYLDGKDAYMKFDVHPSDYSTNRTMIEIGNLIDSNTAADSSDVLGIYSDFFQARFNPISRSFAVCNRPNTSKDVMWSNITLAPRDDDEAYVRITSYLGDSKDSSNFNQAIYKSTGITFRNKTASDLLHAAGGTVSISEIGTQLGVPTLATKEELGNYLPLSGGALTGNIVFEEGRNPRVLVNSLNWNNNTDNYVCGLNWYDPENTTRLGDICYYNAGATDPENNSWIGISANIRNVTAGGSYTYNDTEGDYLFRITATQGVYYNTHKLVENTELSNYLTKTAASNTYQPKGNYLTAIPSEYVTDSELNAKGYQTEAQVAAKVAALVDSAPETLDTLNELAAALGDDPNFATTVTNQIAQKADKTTATTSTAGLMSATDKDRIDKLYTSLSNFGPITHVLDNNAFTQEDGNLKFNFVCTDPASGSTSKSNYNLNVPLATQSQAGAMSASDKSKLDGIASGANKTTVDSALSIISTNPVQNKVINSALDGKAAISHTHTAAQVSGLATVATSGNYNDLSNKPSIPHPTVKAASGTLTLWTGTEAEYNDIATKDPNTLYFILES